MSATVVSVPLVTQRTDEMRRMMAGFIALAGDVSGRCGTCAFREGSDASRAILVPVQIEGCLLSGDTFMCHHGLADGEPPRHACAGFVALSQALLTGARLR